MHYFKKRLPLALAMTLLIANHSALATNNSSNMTAQVNALKQQMNTLQNQLTTLENQLKNKRSTKPQTTSRKTQNHPHKKSTNIVHIVHHYRSFGSYVAIAPYTSTPTHYDGSDLLINTPSINDDVKLLGRRSAEVNYNKAHKIPSPPQPRLVVSGELLGVATGQEPYHGSHNSDINLSTAKLDFFAEIAPWTSGFLSFAYDDSSNNINANRVENSRIYLDQGFITIGNLMKSPFYGSIGQMYVPFGRYSSSMISSPLTEFVGKTRTRAVNLGFRTMHDNGVYGEVFGFPSVSHNSKNRINSYGADLGYHFTQSNWNSRFGMSYISTIADALGFQNTGLTNPLFQGYDNSTVTENIQRNVPGADAYLSLGYKQFSVLAEYIKGLRRFAAQDLTYDGHGAQPSAFNFEGIYNFFMLDKPFTFDINYGFTREALAINLPAERFGATLQAAINPSTLVSLEFRHDINYGKNSTATGDQTNAVTSNQLGKSSNTVTAQLGVYF